MGSPCLRAVPPRQYGRAAQTFRGNAIDPLSGAAAPLWNGKNVRAPMMHFGEGSARGEMTKESGNPSPPFALSHKTLSTDHWFYTQHLAAPLSFSGGLYDDEHHTLGPPYLPELNEFYHD